MSLMKFPDTLLEQLKCSVCSLYLSMAPVGIQPNGQTICSRCTYRLNNASMPQVVARCYIYEEIASLFAFPCQYQPWGCPRYIQFNETEEHESECMYRTFLCPANIPLSCNWKGCAFMLSHHYETKHPELYLNNLNFKLNHNSDEEVYRLVKVDDILLLLQNKCAVKEAKIWFNAVYFGSTHNASFIHYSIKLIGEGTKQFVQLENENPHPTTHMQLIPAQSIEVDINALLGLLKYPKIIKCEWTITIPKELRNKLNDQKKQDRKKLLCITNEVIKCSYCRIFMTPPIFRCPEGHITCIDCKGFDNECIDCQRNKVEFFRAYDLEHLAKSAWFYCKWKKCEKMFYCDKIREHELRCTKRLYKCPCCGERIGKLREVPKHFQQKHIDIQFINESCPSYSMTLDIKDLDVYVFLQNEFLRVRLARYNIAGHFYVKVVISHYVCSRFCYYFKCEVVNNRKGLKHNFNGFSNPYVVTEHITKERYDGIAYFTIELSINENTWIPFDYPFKNVKIKNV